MLFNKRLSSYITSFNGASGQHGVVASKVARKTLRTPSLMKNRIIVARYSKKAEDDIPKEQNPYNFLRRETSEEPVQQDARIDDEDNPHLFRDFGDNPERDKYNLNSHPPPEEFSKEEVEEYEQKERERKMHLHIDGNYADRITSLTKEDRYSWGDLKSKVFGDFGKPKGFPVIRHVAFVPQRQSDEVVEESVFEPEFEDYKLEVQGLGTKGLLTFKTPKKLAPLKGNSAVSASGKRKTSIANVSLTRGSGQILINGRNMVYYFKDFPVRNKVIEPLVVTETLNKWDIICNVQGGGFTGQSEALKLAIAKALVKYDSGYLPPLRLGGFLANDPRQVERKKTGKHGARRSFQWVKR